MKKYILAAIFLFGIFLLASSFKEKKPTPYHHAYRSAGAAASFGWGLTGASFDQPFTCSACHSGGSFAPTLTVELLNVSNNPVTFYIPGASYTLQISIISTSGSPSFGFQTTCAQTSTNNNLNNWVTASLPFYAANVQIASGRNYVEHVATLGNSVINIPWTAPATGYGSVSFFSIGNAVDGTGGTNDDIPTSPNVLTITEGVLPVTFTAFKGEETKSGNQLYWETAQEINNDFFLVEHSSNGRDFTAIGKVIGNGNSTSAHSYSFKHEGISSGKNYYRLAQTDYDGRVKYSQIVTIENKTNSFSINISPNPVVDKIILKGTAGLIGNKYFIVNNLGATVLSGILQADNINVQQLPKGSYFIRILQKDNAILTGQFVK